MNLPGQGAAQFSCVLGSATARCLPVTHNVIAASTPSLKSSAAGIREDKAQTGRKKHEPKLSPSK